MPDAEYLNPRIEIFHSKALDFAVIFPA